MEISALSGYPTLLMSLDDGDEREFRTCGTSTRDYSRGHEYFKWVKLRICGAENLLRIQKSAIGHVLPLTCRCRCPLLE